MKPEKKSRRQKILVGFFLYQVKVWSAGCCNLQMSIKSVCSHQFLRTSWDLKFVVCLPPRLSISIFNTRLKSPPIIWFSLERSSIFWLRFKKNVGLSSFGAYIFVIVSRIPFISISAITYLPSVSIIVLCIISLSFLENNMHAPLAALLPCENRIFPPPVFFPLMLTIWSTVSLL